MARTKRAAADVPVPQTREEADDFIRRIGEAQHRLGMIQAGLDATVAQAKRVAEEEAAPLGRQVEQLTAGLGMWAAANRDALTAGGKTKTVKLPSGELCWRIKPPSVSLSNVKALVDALIALNEMMFLRTKHEVDKDALLRAPQRAAQLPGVKIVAGVEEFIVTPVAEPLSVATDARTAA